MKKALLLTALLSLTGTAAIGQTIRPGDRVEGYDAHMWAPATVTDVDASRVELKFDSNSALYWIESDKVRPLPADKDPQAAQLRQTTYVRPGERVEVRVGQHVWIPATVIGLKAGQIELRRDGNNTTYWMSNADVQPLGTDAKLITVANITSSPRTTINRQLPATPRPVVKRTAGSGPAAPPPGRYQCFFGTFSSWTAAAYGGGDFIANLNLRTNGTYDYANYKGRWSARPGGSVSFSSMPSNYTGAQGYISNGAPGVELQYGRQGVQLCRKVG